MIIMMMTTTMTSCLIPIISYRFLSLSCLFVESNQCEVRKALPKELSSENAPYDTVEQPSKVFIGGLKEDITEEQLRSYFTKFGAIKESTLMYDKTNHRPRGTEL